MSYVHQESATAWGAKLSPRAKRFLAASLREERKEKQSREQDLSQDLEYLEKIGRMLDHMNGWEIDQFVETLR